MKIFLIGFLFAVSAVLVGAYDGPGHVLAQNLATESGMPVSGTRAEERARRMEEIQKLRTANQERRTDARERFAAVKDQNKVKRLERIETNLARINQQATDHFMNVLERLQVILDKISNRATKEGETVPEIATAQTAIDTAEAAVVAQAAKVYDLNISSEATASGQVRTAMQQLKADLAAVRGKVAAARQAVHTAFQALKGVVVNEP